ncbi:hypothetical protein FM107_01705 [Sphingobacterium sp. JB170]|nr:hypothetical protein FM107_01705 [Sphingobacterium sp. JB170]
MKGYVSSYTQVYGTVIGPMQIQDGRNIGLDLTALTPIN